MVMTSTSTSTSMKEGQDGKPKKMCCACPTTKKARDECVVARGEDDERCRALIEAHVKCLRKEGFDV